MNRRTFTTRTLTAIAGLFGASRVSAEVDDNANPEQLYTLEKRTPSGDLIRVSMEKTDIGYYPALPVKKVTILLDGKDTEGAYMVSTLDERGGFVIGLRDGDEAGLDFKRIDGNFTIGGLTREERLAHIDRIKHRVLMGDTAST